MWVIGPVAVKVMENQRAVDARDEWLYNFFCECVVSDVLDDFTGDVLVVLFSEVYERGSLFARGVSASSGMLRWTFF